MNMKNKVGLTLLLLIITSSVKARSIEKRSDDPTPLETVVQQLSAEMAQLKSQLAADEARFGMYFHVHVQYSFVNV
jgi:hypothetical protein